MSGYSSESDCGGPVSAGLALACIGPRRIEGEVDGYSSEEVVAPSLPSALPSGQHQTQGARGWKRGRPLRDTSPPASPEPAAAAAQQLVAYQPPAPAPLDASSCVATSAWLQGAVDTWQGPTLPAVLSIIRHIAEPAPEAFLPGESGAATAYIFDTRLSTDRPVRRSSSWTAEADAAGMTAEKRYETYRDRYSKSPS